jgi:transposase-like protein
VVAEEDVKERIAAEICSGHLSQAEAARQYGIHRATIWEWVQLYGRVKHRRRVEIVMSDQKEKIEELQKALGEAHLKLQLYEGLLDIAKTKYKIDLKKNIGTTSSPKAKRKRPK